MVKQLSGLEIRFLMKELEELVGARVEKIYNRDDVFFFHLYTGEKKILTLWPEKGIYIGEGKHDKTPSNFCMVLRKHLRNSRITKVEQVGFERIIKIYFTKKDSFELVLETIKPGNIILIQDESIVFPLRIRKYRSRWIKPKEKYIPPTSNKKIDDFKESEKQDVVRFLAVDVGFGGKYAEELCLRAGIDKKKPLEEMDEEDAKNIKKALDEFLSQDLEPKIIDGELVPTKMKLYSAKGDKYESMSEAIAEYLKEIKKEEPKKEVKINEMIAEEIIAFNKKAEKARRKAEVIMKDFDSLQTVVRGIKKAVEEYGWGKTRELIDNYDGIETNRITGVFPDENLVIVDDDIEIELYRSLGENMNRYYDLAKKYERKIVAAKEKIIEFEKKPKKRKVIAPKRKGGWYEKFRWFYSSEGFLVISGRNATQNEEIIKKYMEQGDLVFHADIHGSPFTVIKNGKKSSEKTRQEAAIQTISYSKAWGMGHGSGNVYYVEPYQVKQQAPSGMYMGKGSFLISGKKNYFKNLKLGISVGFSEKIISGPRTAIRKKTNNYVIVYPGAESREKTADKIMNVLSQGTDYIIIKDDIVKVLPGKCRVWNI